METSTEQPKSALPELQRRHKATVTTVHVLLILTVLLSAIAFLINGSLPPRNNPSLDIAVRIIILVFGLGAITLRRTKFATMRLQDIGALKGASGLLITLQRTTLQVAILGAIIAVVGFVATLLTANPFYSYGAGLVAVAVLLYCYPVRSSWEKAIKRFAPGPQSN
jgi:peptidoglycan/LPS O-acetylase OafA/YrhL